MKNLNIKIKDSEIILSLETCINAFTKEEAELIKAGIQIDRDFTEIAKETAKKLFELNFLVTEINGTIHLNIEGFKFSFPIKNCFELFKDFKEMQNYTSLKRTTMTHYAEKNGNGI